MREHLNKDLTLTKTDWWATSTDNVGSTCDITHLVCEEMFLGKGLWFRPFVFLEPRETILFLEEEKEEGVTL